MVSAHALYGERVCVQRVGIVGLVRPVEVVGDFILLLVVAPAAPAPPSRLGLLSAEGAVVVVGAVKPVLLCWPPER
jgi:hypothetical protein